MVSPQPGWRTRRFPCVGYLLTPFGSVHVVKQVLRHLTLIRVLLRLLLEVRGVAPSAGYLALSGAPRLTAQPT